MDQDNYFSLFSIPVSYSVDDTELASRYLSLQKSMHPDKFAQCTEQERLFSVKQTARLNDAYMTLKSPLLRARYLLQIIGYELSDDKNTIMDPAFLMQQMELREAISMAKQKKMGIEEFEETIDHIDDLYNSNLAEIKRCFDDPKPAYDQVSDVIRKLQFITKLREEADHITDSLTN